MANSDPVKIEGKIVRVEVVNNDQQLDPPTPQAKAELPKPTVPTKRPESLQGETYKIVTPLSEHSLYVTINNAVINGKTVPAEIFINSRDMKNFQWITSLTRMISAIFRTGGDVTFVLEELKSTYDPNGGYLKRGVYVPSLVAEVGLVLEHHFKKYGIIESEVMDETTRKFIEDKLAEAQKDDPNVMDNATICPECKEKSFVALGGCPTCTSCGYSKCG